MNHDHDTPLGISGRLAASFQNSALTPLLAIVALLLGFFAIAVTPKEEEPQIDVTFANIFISYPGASAKEVEQLIAIPAQQVLAELSGVDDIFSISRPGQAILTVAFEVGIPREQAIVKLYNQVESHRDWLPQGLNIPKPIVKPMGIDDVPIMALTLSAKAGLFAFSREDLTRLAHSLETELKTIAGTRDVYTLGEHRSVLTITLDSSRMNGHGITFADISQRLKSANIGGQLSPIIENNQVIKLRAGAFLNSIDDVKNLVIARTSSTTQQESNQQGLVYLADIATIELQADSPSNYVVIKTPANPKGQAAVTLVIAKQPGTNAVDITNAVSEHLITLQNRLIPESVLVTETRNYGITAENKSNKLIGKLLFATLAVVLLVLATMSWREAIIVGSAIFITLALTLFASWVWGFTLNRVSLFALIFSIGILVDDAIVVVENIHRHMQLEKNKPVTESSQGGLLGLIPKAVEEVGSPTILATFTVIAALMPMAFVSGLMGPYMSPIPINASTGMLISLLVAFIITPWLAYKLLRHSHNKGSHSHAAAEEHAGESDNKVTESKPYMFFQYLMSPFIISAQARRNRWALMIATMTLILLAVSLPVMKLVVLKMLPFDNKSELQIIVDMPEGTTLEQTLRVLDDLSDYAIKIEEVKDIEIYAGNSAPINFNGLVRQYYLRQAPHQGDLQINLVAKSQRDRQSHDIALALRVPLQEIGQRFNANVKIVEVPPGPPVMASISAEVYGLSYPQQLQASTEIQAIFQQTDDIVDIDSWLDAPQQQWNLVIQRNRAMMLGLSEQAITQAITAATSGWDISYLHSEQQKYALPIRLRLGQQSRDQLAQLLVLKIRNQTGAMIALGEVVKLEKESIEQTIYHKNQRPVMFVTADMAGALDSPLYGLFDISGRIQEQRPNWQQKYIAQPSTPGSAQDIEIKWDGEWQITYETFRDMGIAYGIGMILIYLLVVAQFRSYLIPLVVMAPIPLTLIGVMPGHALLGAQFTATSMIGMIALAGIIVRNSILLVDFINQQLAKGIALEQAVIQSAAVRAKPIILTGVAAMTGAFFILDDPIFNGLAISLIFGILVSTLMTLVLIPLLFFVLKKGR
ncbi:MAG: efflux RND transporter permease subunit [Oleispira sp.]